MKRAFLSIFTLFSLISYSAATPSDSPEVKKAKALKAFINKEKIQFDLRESQKKSLMEALDTLNADQNKVRERVMSLGSNQQELTMALENLSLDFQKQRQLEQLQRQRLYLLLKVVYKIKNEGMVRFVFFGRNLSELAGRVRILYRTLRSHTQITHQLQERAERMAESEAKLKQAKAELNSLLDDLHEQEGILSDLLAQKKNLVSQISKKQNYYQIAVKEYKRLSIQITTLFDSLPSAKVAKEKKHEPVSKKLVATKGSLPIPVSGRIIQGFGKTVHEKFGTVTFHKGIEIESEFNAPVAAVLPGDVEYSGWLRGLGNVLILHHGGGIYTLSAHLFKLNKDVGAKVEQGDVVGYVGDTGTSENPSLYFELRENGKAVDPLAYFSKNAASNLN